MSWAPERGSMATATVRARSWAEMPVVTPSRASIETVKAVSWRDGVGLRHQRQAEGVEPLAGEREADQAAAVGGHEVDRGRRAHLRRDDEVALVLAVLVVDEDEHPAVARVLDDLLDRGDRVGIVVRRERGHAAIRWCRAARYRRAGGKARAGCAGGDGGARLAAVQTVYSPLHARHAGNVELNSGAIVPAFELPRRAEMVRARVAEVGLGADRAAGGARPRDGAAGACG